MLITWLVAAMMVREVLAEAGCDRVWETFLKGKMPTEKSFSRFKLLNSPQCYNMCARTQGCKAMSYNVLSSLCQLYTEESSDLLTAPDSLYGKLVDEGLSESCFVLTKERLNCKHCPKGYACVYSPYSEIAEQCIPVADCYEPPDFPKTTKSFTDTKVGSEVMYRCVQGHVFNGSWLNISCTYNGSWTPLQGNCIANCSTPPKVDHANVTAGNTTEGSKVNYTFSCPLGMVLRDDVTAVCNSSGRWEGPQGRCQLVDCGPPPTLAKATFIGNATTNGSSVTYTCEAGFVYNGSRPSAVCMHSGNWTVPDGTCIANCSTPPEVAHANVTAGNTTEGSKANYTFSCPLGSVLRGDVTAVCNSSRLWEGPQGRCQLVDCRLPPTLANASFIGNATTNGSSVNYTCEAGFVYNVSRPSAVCMHSGNWTVPDGTCIANCSHPPAKDNATLTFDRMTEGGVASYDCVAGMEMQGEQNETCLPTGTWSASTGPCQRCNSSLTANIPDDSFTASEHFIWNIQTFPSKQARIHSTTAWVGMKTRGNGYSWLQIDLRGIREVTAVQTLGRKDADQYVKIYTLSWGNHTSSWKGNMTFGGNSKKDILQTNDFDSPIIARYFRFSINHCCQIEGHSDVHEFTDFYSEIAMRIEFLGCPP